jgi:1-pyrroline-5-carboxylate dehydrogenase
MPAGLELLSLEGRVMSNSIPRVPEPRNEPVFSYAPNAWETKVLKDQLSQFASMEIDIPVVIDGREMRTGKTQAVHLPHNHRHRIATSHQAGPEDVRAAIRGASVAAKDWGRLPFSERAAVFLKAAELLSTKYRPILNAATMLGQSKTCYQAEIDAACELVDFFRFNVHFQEMIYGMQPNSSSSQWNRLEYRPLEGFVLAVTPFNFTSIGGNLPTAPALMGNVVLWKPASTSIYSSYFIMRLLDEAGLPPGVIQFLPGPGSQIGEIVLKDPAFAGLHFTGSTATFNSMWKTIGNHMGNYRSYPRLVGETGGKDFVFVHASADAEALTAAIVRGAFEYQGQKCSAASRAYVPRSLWGELKERLVAEVQKITMGDVTEFRNFMSAVIDRKSFDNIRSYLEEAKKNPDVEILIGGNCDDETGYFVEPTVLVAKTPNYRTMCEEIFGPVMTIYVYEDAKFEETLKICDETSPYALTGAIFARDRAAVQLASERLAQSAGNFYINNKPTGAVVGQQPFGGARASGTNDKAGSLFNLIRWVSLRTVSETFAPPRSYRYPFMGEE